jgi:hypothetical protein
MPKFIILSALVAAGLASLSVGAVASTGTAPTSDTALSELSTGAGKAMPAQSSAYLPNSKEQNVQVASGCNVHACK